MTSSFPWGQGLLALKQQRPKNLLPKIGTLRLGHANSNRLRFIRKDAIDRRVKSTGGTRSAPPKDQDERDEEGMGASTLTGFPEGLFSGASGFLHTDSPLHRPQKRRLAPGLKFANCPISNF
jgi:hypothetical protein